MLVVVTNYHSLLHCVWSERVEGRGRGEGEEDNKEMSALAKRTMFDTV